MISTILSHLQVSLALLISGGLAAAGFWFLGVKGAIPGALAFLAVSAYQTGVNHERERSKVSTLQVELAQARNDLKIARDAEKDAESLKTKIEKDGEDNAKRIRELETDLATRPAADRCLLNRGDLRRLQSIR